MTLGNVVYDLKSLICFFKLTWNDDIQDKTNILPWCFNFGDIGNQSPHLSVLIININHTLSHEFNCLGLFHLKVSVAVGTSL